VQYCSANWELGWRQEAPRGQNLRRHSILGVLHLHDLESECLLKFHTLGSFLVSGVLACSLAFQELSGSVSGRSSYLASHSGSTEGKNANPSIYSSCARVFWFSGILWIRDTIQKWQPFIKPNKLILMSWASNHILSFVFLTSVIFVGFALQYLCL
jgi:hypothetical protein